MTNEMKLEDVIRFAVKIEYESELFYGNAVKMATSDNVKILLGELRDEEAKHGKRLSSLIIIEARNKIVETTDISILIKNKPIPSDATEKEALIIALEREEATRDFYGSIATLTNIDSLIIDTFDMLFDQESGHVAKIKNKLKQN